MIDIVTGEIVREGEDFVVIMVGGIGLNITVTRSVLQQVDRENAVIYTHLHVREDILALYGFVDEHERSLFQVLTSVSGVGSRTGIQILSTLNREHLQNAVLREEANVLTRVPGIGKKTAKKIIFELKDKLQDTVGDAPVLISDVDSDVLAALTALGYSVMEAQAALQSIPNDAPQDVETRVVMALQHFAD